MGGFSGQVASRRWGGSGEEMSWPWVLSLVKSHVLAARVLLFSVKHLFNTSNSHGSTDIYIYIGFLCMHGWMEEFILLRR